MNIKLSNTFKKQFKKYLKKDKNLINEFEKVLDSLKENPKLGVSLGDNLFKIRLKGFNKGKSGGYRIINYIIADNNIQLVFIYAKNDISTIRVDEIISILKKELK